ncbi:solute carrier family 66 member 2-like isoform X2 [Crassostrea virginica]
MPTPDYMIPAVLLEPFSGLTMPSLLEMISIGCQGAMIFGGVIPFIPQYLDIKRSGNADGFSTFVCLNLLIANILRILFWFGRHFELPLLAQSIIMVFTMLALTEICVRVKHKGEIVASKEHKFSGEAPPRINRTISPVRKFVDFDRAYFWKWTYFESYVQFTVVFTVLVGLTTWLFLDNMYYVETIGFLAVFAEAMLGAPQFHRNFINKSTHGMSKKMVAMWTCGDCFKTGYFIVRHAPAQFWICGMLQVGIDISIFLQVYCYRNKAAIS